MEEMKFLFLKIILAMRVFWIVSFIVKPLRMILLKGNLLMLLMNVYIIRNTHG